MIGLYGSTLLFAGVWLTCVICKSDKTDIWAVGLMLSVMITEIGRQLQ